MNRTTASNASLGKLLRGALLGSACVGALTAVPAVAQDNGAVETVVVTGIIGSLQRDLDIKRDSVGIVDAISAEDIGKFPDSNMAAAMQRIPGVSVSRGVSSFGSTGSVTTTGDATEITVRGFGPSFNQTLYDGRVVPTALGNRGFDFSSVSSDFVSQIDIMKSPDASLASGAIGATINIKYPKPFDHPGFRLVGSLSGTVSPEEGKIGPNGDVLFSDTFAHDTFGVLVDLSYNDTRTRMNHVNIQGWIGTHLAPSQMANAPAGASTTADPSNNAWFIQDYGIYQEHANEERITGRAVIQWRPADNVEVTLNDDFSRDNNQELQYGYSVWFNGGALTDVTQNSNGTITNFVQPNTPTDFQSQRNGQLIQSNDLGVNVKWNVTDKFSMMLDYDNAQQQLNPGGRLSALDADVGYGPSQPAGIYGVDLTIAGVAPHSLPYPTAYGPSGNKANFLGAGIIGSHVLPAQSPRNRDSVNQAKLEAEWSGNTLDVKAGFQYVADHYNLSEYDSFQNSDWQAYAGYGAASNNFYHAPGQFYDGYPAGATLPQSMFTHSFSTKDFISGFGGSNNLPPQVLQFSYMDVLNYLQGLGNPQATHIMGYNYPSNLPYTGTYDVVQNVGAFQHVYEDNYAGYISATENTQLGSMPLKINVGVREEITDLTSAGIGQQPTSLAVQAADHTAYQVFYTGTTNITVTNSYQYLLPNLDLTLGLTDDMQLRFDASRTLTRPNLNYLTPVTNVPQGLRVGALTASGGNPYLLPYLSDNLDLGWEWYYAPNSYVSIDGFEKTVSNFIVAGTSQQHINNVVLPPGVAGAGSIATFTVTGRVNGPTANVFGGEFALQHVFADSGFGFQLNATIVSTNKPYNPLDLTNAFAVTGLADSANLVAFYDKDGFQARVAANWRDGYLDHFTQLQNGGLWTEPTFVNPSMQIDFSTSYDFTDQISFYLEALNLNDATYSTHGRFSEQVLDAVDYGRRFTFGVHFKY